MIRILITLFYLPIISYGQITDEENYDIVYNDSLYKITSTPKEMGEIFTIFNKKDKTSFTIDQSLYFIDVYRNYMITDEGSGSIRGMRIYNLINKKEIFSAEYVGDVEILKNKIHFKYIVEIENNSEKPVCPQKIIDIGYGLCYLEELIYDLDGNKFTATGKYECSYCE